MRFIPFFLRVVTLGVLLLPAFSMAAIQLPLLLSNDAIIQRDQPVSIWGWAEPEQTVTIKLNDRVQVVDSDAQGEWQAIFEPLKAGVSVSLVVKAGGEIKTVNNMLAGDVWVASGQSNMEWLLQDSLGAETELQLLNNTNIRHFKIPKSWSVAPENRLAGGEWFSATSEHAGEFSGVAYFFAKKVAAQTGVPIGIIGSNWGGSSIETWMSYRALGLSAEEIQQVLGKHKQKNDDYRSAQLKQMQRWPGALVNKLGDADADWSAAELQTNEWAEISVPSLWEGQGYNGVDGIIWYRKQFQLTHEDIAGGITLGLGRIDDNDITWVNGVKVGETRAFNEIRTYSVPESALKPGLNSIAIRVEDTGGGGGIYSDVELLYVQTAEGKKTSLAGEWLFRPDKVFVDTDGAMNQVETALYNKMMYPLFQYPVKGVIWYQGESNAFEETRATQYARQFQQMIIEWRQKWAQPELAFYWVQLASFDTNDGDSLVRPWATLRESQTAALTLPNTGQAIAIDVGDANDIHPRDKKTVGERLAVIALNKTYGDKKQHYRGPELKSVKLKGTSLVIKFNSAKGLAIRDGQASVLGFELVDQAGKLVPLEGLVKGTKVVLKLNNRSPVEVRYAWDDSPVNANLMDTTGLPAEPFRVKL